MYIVQTQVLFTVTSVKCTLYKLKYFLQLKTRIQVYHRFVQYYLLLLASMGFLCQITQFLEHNKRGVESCNTGLHTIFRYRDGVTKGHTKPLLNDYDILAVQGVIEENTLIVMYKIPKYAIFRLHYHCLEKK